MYEFLYAAFEGFLTYKERQVVPLTKLGLVWLTGLNFDTKKGSNGAGKSSLIDFLRLILYEAASDEIMFGQKNYLGEVCFKAGDLKVNIYQFRKLTIDKKRELAATLNIEEKSFKPSGYLIFVNGKNKTPSGIPACRKKIAQLFKLTEEEFLGGVHITPERAHTLLKGSAPERRRYFENTFSVLTSYKKLQDKIGVRYDKTKERISDLDDIASQLEVYESQFIELKDQKTLEVLISDLNDKYDSLSKDKIDLKKKIADIDKKREINKNRKNVLAELEKIPQVDKTAYNKAETENEEFSKKREKYAVQIKSIEIHNEVKRDFDAVKKTIKEREIDVNKDYDAEIEKIEEKRNKYRAQLLESENLLKKFKKLDGENCPTCSQSVSKEFVQSNIKSLNKIIDENTLNETKATKRIKSLRGDAHVLSAYKNIKKQWERHEIPENSSLDDLETKSKKLKLKIKENETLISNYEKRQQWETHLEKYPKQELPNKELYLKFKDRYEKISKEFELIVKEKTEYELNLSQSKKLKKKIQQCKEQLVDYPKLSERLKLYDYLYTAYGDKGIKVKQITNLCQKLVEQLPKYVSLMSQEKNLTFTTNMKKDDFSIIAHRHFSNKRKKSFDIRRFSTGEKKRFIPALMLAQNLLIPKNKRTNLFIADELDANLDGVAKKAFVNNLVPVLKQKFDSVIVIAHSKEMKPIGSKDWRVVKKNGISKLEILDA